MDERVIPGTLISTDPAFRGMVRQALAASGRGITLACEIAVPLTEMDSASLGELQRVDPEVIFLDLEPNPGVAIRFAHFLTESNPRRQFIAAGPVLPPELLLEAMRAGISEYLTEPVTLEALSAALDRVQRKLGVATNGSAARAPGKLLSTFSVKGGSGATTVATNLAIHLAQLTGKKTLLVDLNLELGEVALFLGMQPRFTFVDMIRNLHRMDAELLASYLDRHESGVHLLAGPLDPGAADATTVEGIHQILGFLRQHYDFVVVDTSRSFDRVTLAALQEADEVFLVTRADIPSLRNIKRTLPLLERTVGRLEDKVRLVVNRYQPDDPISLEEVRRTLGMSVYATLANEYDVVIRSINSGKPVALDHKSKFNRELGALAVQVAGVASKNGRKGPLGSFRTLFRRKEEAVRG